MRLNVFSLVFSAHTEEPVGDMMRKIAAMSIVIGAYFSASGSGSAKSTDSLDAESCTVWPEPILQPITLRSPCSVSFRGRGRSGDGKNERTEYEIIRAGIWERQRWLGLPDQQMFTNYGSGATFYVRPDAAGEPTFSIELGNRKPRGEARKTAETITYLDETCRVWVTAQPHTGTGMEHQDCVTEDGIPLLRDYATNRAGTLSEKLVAGTPIAARMMRFERAPVGQSEVRPPAMLFRWSSWGVLGQKSLDDERSYEVRLEDKGDEVSRRPASAITLRRLSQTELVVKRQGGRIHTVKYRSPSRIVEFGSYDDGRPHILRVQSISGNLARMEARLAAGSGPPKALEETETILSEGCRWYNLFPNMQDASREECRTGDGIPLARRETSWGRQTLIARATVVRRQSMEPKDLLPPSELISPHFWLRPHSRR